MDEPASGVMLGGKSHAFNQELNKKLGHLTRKSSWRTNQASRIHNPVVIGPDALLEEAAKLVLNWEVGALPVVNEEGVLVGIITYADLLREFLARDKQI